MAQFIIQTDHTEEECLRVLDSVLQAGAHYLFNADWGCHDGVHSAWMMVEAGTHDEARNIIPPAFRRNARLVQLNKFTPEEIKQLHEKYGS